MRKIAQKYLRSKVFITLMGLIAVVGLIFLYLPKEILNALPATGGDTGSHFWPLYTLVKQALPQFHIKVWNPGNLGGEPQLVHYFPLPFLIMALLSLIMPIGTAFNIGSMLPVAVFPLCVYYGLKLFRLRFPIPLLAAAFSLSYLYNESFSMWGGNTLSTLAGQFAHVYAFDFFLIGLGAMAWELRKSRPPIFSSLLFAATLTSHFYVGLLLPFVYLTFLFCERTLPFKERLKHLGLSAVLANLLSLWFVIPMIDNAKWTSAYAFQWQSANLLLEVFPTVFWPFIGLMAAGSLIFLTASFYKKPFEEEWRVAMPLMLVIVFVSGAMFYIFPQVGLVDIRALPQIQMVVCIIAAIFVGLFLKRYLSRLVSYLLVLPLVIGSVWWASHQVKNFPSWMKWNYSGWQAKVAYPELQKMYEVIRGDFSMGRIAYENNELANSAGTIRVFEMLPYFSGRATTESVYHQATIYAPFAFYFQGLISISPSCPFSQFSCGRYTEDKTSNYMDLLGISQMVVMTPEVVGELDKKDHLKKLGQYGIFHLYEKITPTTLVDVISKPVEFFEGVDYKDSFFTWFLNYKNGESHFLVNATDLDQSEKQALSTASVGGDNCNTALEIHFDKLKLSTACPGKLHLLKFAFHPAWKSLNGEKLYLVSPGYIGIIPEKSETKLIWGDRPLWNISAWISWLAFAVVLFLGFRFYRSQNRKDPL